MAGPLVVPHAPGYKQTRLCLCNMDTGSVGHSYMTQCLSSATEFKFSCLGPKRWCRGSRIILNHLNILIYLYHYTCTKPWSACRRVPEIPRCVLTATNNSHKRLSMLSSPYLTRCRGKGHQTGD